MNRLLYTLMIILVVLPAAGCASPTPSTTPTASLTSSATLLPTDTPAPTQPPTSTPTPKPQNIALRKPVSASHFLNTDPPGRVVDGNNDTLWNAGAHPPQWIQIDLQGAFDITRVTLKASQSPEGETTHRVIGQDIDGNERLLHIFNGATRGGQTLDYSPETPWRDITKIRVETLKSPSWVGWWEVQVFSASAPRPLPEISQLATPTPPVVAASQAGALHPGWASYTNHNEIFDLDFDSQGRLWAVGRGGAVLWNPQDASYQVSTRNMGWAAT